MDMFLSKCDSYYIYINAFGMQELPEGDETPTNRLRGTNPDFL